MAIKRLGGSSAASKLDTIGAAVSSGLSDVSRQLEAPLDRSRGSYERVALDNVFPDPENPRHLQLTFDELRQGVTDLQQGTEAETARQKIYESISGLSATLKDLGQLQPITTYRDERGRLRIVDGERRYWGARLLGWTHIDAKVRSKRPEYVRLEQYVANVQREDLTLDQHLNNLEMLVEEAQGQGHAVTSLTQLAALINLPRTTVQRWWGVLRGPQDVRDAIRTGTLQSIKHAYTAAQERDSKRRAALLACEVVPARGAKSQTKRAGRPKRRISLGATKDVELIRTIIQAISVDQSFAEVDWSDLATVQGTWQRFLKALESKIRSTRTSKDEQ